MVKKNFLKSSLIVLAVVAMTVAFLPISGVKAASGVDKIVPTLTYSAHVQNVGWTSNSKAGEEESEISRSLAGSEGKSQRLEALKVTFKAPAGVVLKYNAHIQGIGWTGWNEITEANQLIGTEGQSKRLEAIKFSVTGLTGYEIKYRAHVQSYGWMDWKTADSSQTETGYAGTQGQSKRIEAIEVLILKTTDADIFDARQEAISDLRTYADARDYKINAKLLQQEIEKGIVELNKLSNNSVGKIATALTTAEAAINDILTDRQISERLTALNETIDEWKKQTGAYETLGENVADKPELGKYYELPAMKEAIAVAKAEAASKESYKDADFATLLEDAKKSIRYAFKEYVLDLAEDMYNTKVTSTDAKVLKQGTYNEIKTALSDTEEEKKDLGFSDIKTQLNKLYNEEDSFEKLEDQQSWAKDQMDSILATSPYSLAIFKSGSKQVTTGVADKLKLLFTPELRRLATNYPGTWPSYGEISYIKEAIADGKIAVNNTRSSAEVNAAIEETTADALSGLRLFINETINELVDLENASGLVLRTATNPKYNDLVAELANKDATATSLLDAFVDVLSNLTEAA